MNDPLISVITVVYNGAGHLAQCLDSVRIQQGSCWEHLVIDGGSSDGSVALIRQRQDRLSYWCSEPDSGISHAMNKGVVRARGKWLLFLHADDQLLSANALRGGQAVLSNSKADVVGFPLRFGSTQEQSKLLYPRGAGAWLNLKTGLLHQATFIRRALFEHLGGYDLNLKVAMDYEFFLRAKRAGAQFALTTAPVLTLMRDTGLSSRRDWPSLSQRFAEERYIHYRHADRWSLKFIYRLYWPAYLLYRRASSALKSECGV